MKSKFKPGEKVYYISVMNDMWCKSYAEISIDVIESVVFYKDKVTYWLPSCEWEVEESNVIPYDKDSLFKYLDVNLHVNDGEEK